MGKATDDARLRVDRLDDDGDVERLQTQPTKPSDDGQTPTPDGQPATAQDLHALFHTVDAIPATVWLASLAAASERFVWYASTAPFQNYLQQTQKLSQARAAAVVNAFYAVAAFSPVPGALLADAWLGRYEAMLASLTCVLAGSILLFFTSLPAVMEGRESAAAVGLALAMVLFAVGSGGMRAAATPFIGDQYTETVARVRTRKDGERVVTDRELTIQYIYNAFFWITNVAGLAALGTTFLEKYVGFWAAYLPGLIVNCLGFIPLLLARERFVRTAPSGTVLIQAWRILAAGARGGFKLDAATPDAQLARRGRAVPWTEGAVDELRLTMLACRILAFFPVHWLCANQTFNNLIAQAGQMQGHGVPNDAIKSTNPVSAIILYPVVQRGLYPLLRRWNVRFGSAARITLGFALLTLAMVYAAVLQSRIYAAAPCFAAPLDCPAGRGEPNDVSLFIQMPVYTLGALAEIFCLTSATEHAYHNSPQGMRSIVQAVSLGTSGVGSLLAMAVNPLARDPQQVALYALIAGLMGAATALFWLYFHKIDRKRMEML